MRGTYADLVADNRPFDTLGKQFEEVSRNLKQRTNLQERRQLLRRMRLVINKVDQLTFKEPFHADSMRDSTVRPFPTSCSLTVRETYSWIWHPAQDPTSGTDSPQAADTKAPSDPLLWRGCGWP
jgi:hypothetical protein